MSRQRRRPGSLPVNYQLARLPREKVLARIEAGARLRRGQHDTGAGAEGHSIYNRRGVLALETR